MSNFKYKINFENNQIITQNFSQSAQDIFVLSCLNGKKNGTFLDLGCNHPVNINNTYLLEKDFGWKGLSIDIDKNFTNLYQNVRSTPAITEDCTIIDFDMVMTYFDTNHIDYLSLDLEPANITMMCLKNIPFEKVEFSIITFEHDSYRFGNIYRDESREIFEKNGYKLICKDVTSNGLIFEDWYYNPKYVKFEDIMILQSDSKEGYNIISD